MLMPLLSLKNDRQPLLLESEDPGEMLKLFCGLQNKLQNFCYLMRQITIEMNKPIVLP